MISLSLHTLLITCVAGQEHFRSILIERACQKRPSLNFCGEISTPASINAPKNSNKELRLILPPNPDKEPMDLTTSSVHLKLMPDSITDNSTEDVFMGQTPEIEERLGSLLRLPKPYKSDANILSEKGERVLSTEDKLQNPLENENDTLASSNTENERSVLVLVSEYCVIEREHFVKKCHGDVDKNEMSFCKSYPSACAATSGVIPVLSYCQRYYKQYPRLCTQPKIQDDAIQFCFAFEQFCLPELTPASQAPVSRPHSSLRKCQDVLPEARRICNPFPHPKDTFNVLRCSQFLTNCKKFVDWA